MGLVGLINCWSEHLRPRRGSEYVEQKIRSGLERPLHKVISTEVNGHDVLAKQKVPDCPGPAVTWYGGSSDGKARHSRAAIDRGVPRFPPRKGRLPAPRRICRNEFQGVLPSWDSYISSACFQNISAFTKSNQRDIIANRKLSKRKVIELRSRKSWIELSWKGSSGELRHSQSARKRSRPHNSNCQSVPRVAIAISLTLLLNQTSEGDLAK